MIGALMRRRGCEMASTAHHYGGRLKTIGWSSRVPQGARVVRGGVASQRRAFEREEVSAPDPVAAGANASGGIRWVLSDAAGSNESADGGVAVVGRAAANGSEGSHDAV
jgi:hypothetical protein